MFTGLIEKLGTVSARAARTAGARLTIQGAPGPLALGESVAVDGVCLTVDKLAGEEGFEADASAETLARTTLGRLFPGSPVNLERALAVGDRLGGHIVSGHVDGTGELAERRPMGDALFVAFRMPAGLARFVAEKGSICVNGVSLTVNHVEPGGFDAVLVPHTRQKTTLDTLRVGDAVNLEVDLLARYVARLLEAGSDPSGDAAWLDRLRAGGFL
jgi:riboflavin synthase